MKDLVDTNMQVTDELKQDNDELNKELNKHDSDLDKINTLLKHVMVQNQTPSPDKTDSPKYQNTKTLVRANKKKQLSEGGNYTRIDGMWTLKNDIIPPKFYELLINTELKGDTDMDLRKFYNHIKMCLNVVTRLQEDLLPGYQSIKIHSDIE